MRSKSLVVVLGAWMLVGCQAKDSRTPADGAAPSPNATDKDTASGGGLGGIIKALKPEPVVLPAGTELPLVFDTTVSSATNQPGDSVAAKLASEVRVGEKLVLPAGSEVRGKVTTAVSSGRVKGRARLGVAFDTLVYDGKDYVIATEPIDITAPKTHKKDAEIIGGGAAAGAIIGAIAGGKKGALIGTGVGGGAGTGAVLATKGKEVTLPAGTTRTVTLTSETRLD